jgi:hypothetical protein
MGEGLPMPAGEFSGVGKNKTPARDQPALETKKKNVKKKTTLS